MDRCESYSSENGGDVEKCPHIKEDEIPHSREAQDVNVASAMLLRGNEELSATACVVQERTIAPSQDLPLGSHILADLTRSFAKCASRELEDKQPGGIVTNIEVDLVERRTCVVCDGSGKGFTITIHKDGSYYYWRANIIGNKSLDLEPGNLPTNIPPECIFTWKSDDHLTTLNGSYYIALSTDNSRPTLKSIEESKSTDDRLKVYICKSDNQPSISIFYFKLGDTYFQIEALTEGEPKLVVKELPETTLAMSECRFRTIYRP